MPVDELDCAEATLTVLQQVLHGIGKEDESKQTPCREFDVVGLTDHLMNSITLIGGAAGAQFPDRDTNAAIETQVMDAARPALDAWQERGLEGTVSVGPNEAPAKVFAGILSLEFLVHAWDYAKATDKPIAAPDELTDYVLGIARQVITDRSGPGFDEPVPISDDAKALDRLIAYTGRQPAG
jgi:uncharacterized protein (TIGR03086 family)